MSPETPGVAVALVAALCRALERFLVAVSQQVPVEMVLPLERLMADGAEVLPLVAVGQPVLGQSRGVAEHFVAEAAFLGTGGLAVAPQQVPWRGLGQHQGGPGGGEIRLVPTGGRAGRGREDGGDFRYRAGAAGQTVGRLVDAEQHVIDLTEMVLQVAVLTQVQAGEVQGGRDGGGTRVVGGGVESDEVALVGSLGPVLGLQSLQDLAQRDVLGGVLNVVVKVRVLQLD